MKIVPCLLVTLALVAVALPADGQSTGGQGSNKATPMQQTPAGTPPGTNAAAPSDQQFVTTAAIANRFEIMEAELALAQASDPGLKELARMMVMDHTAALKKLEAAAKAAGLAVPADPALDPPHQAKINALKARKGADFDQAYRSDQNQAHQGAVTLLESYQRIGAKEPLRAWAAKTLPAVQKHLAAITAMNAQ